jgi:phosphoglycolate phosphatase-like HAD superfamily hydrolase
LCDGECLHITPPQSVEKTLQWRSPTTRFIPDDFEAEVKKWLDTARDPRWKRPYTALTYLPMIELLKYLRANGFKTYIVTGGGQDFVRVYSEEVYGIPPEQVVGIMGGTKEGYDKEGQGPAGRVGIRMAAATGLAHGTAQEVGGARAGQRQAAHRSGGTTGDVGMDLKRGGKSQNRDLAKPSQR